METVKKEKLRFYTSPEMEFVILQEDVVRTSGDGQIKDNSDWDNVEFD